MGKTKPLGRGLAALAGTAVLSTEAAAADDDTGAALGNEQRRYERAVLDFEAQVYRQRDAMRAEHHENLRAIFEGRESE